MKVTLDFNIKKFISGFILIAVIALGSFATFVTLSLSLPPEVSITPANSGLEHSLERFSSAEEFRSYLEYTRGGNASSNEARKLPFVFYNSKIESGIDALQMLGIGIGYFILGIFVYGIIYLILSFLVRHAVEMMIEHFPGSKKYMNRKWYLVYGFIVAEALAVAYGYYEYFSWGFYFSEFIMIAIIAALYYVGFLVSLLVAHVAGWIIRSAYASFTHKPQPAIFKRKGPAIPPKKQFKKIFIAHLILGGVVFGLLFFLFLLSGGGYYAITEIRNIVVLLYGAMFVLSFGAWIVQRIMYGMSEGKKPKPTNNTLAWALGSFIVVFSSFIILQTLKAAVEQRSFSPSPVVWEGNDFPDAEPFTLQGDSRNTSISINNPISFDEVGPQEFGAYADVQSGPLSAQDGLDLPSFDLFSKRASTPSDSTVNRTSETNVQVLGIDEPDILKVSGSDLYVSSVDSSITVERFSRFRNNSNEVSLPDTRIVQAFPAERMNEIAQIPHRGEMLLQGNSLVVHTGTSIVGYDVRDTDNPVHKWTKTLSGGTEVVALRLLNGNVYAVMRSSINSSRPCPYSPYSSRSEVGDFFAQVSLNCSDIYHPTLPQNAQAIYSVIVFEPTEGRERSKTAFLGTSSDQTVYMSADSLYVGTKYQADQTQLALRFIADTKREILTDSDKDIIDSLSIYDSQSYSRGDFIEKISQNYNNKLERMSGLSRDWELLMTQRQFEQYLKNSARSLNQTGIAKIDLQNMTVTAAGSVPGELLNQFSLDEYDGNLRVATTIQPSNVLGVSIADDSVSEVHALNRNMKPLGMVGDMGEGEKIYSVRFIKDRGYVVTFREVDPFYVLDLSDPENPEVKGELKIPGFSSYLHPLQSDIILGVGRDEGAVKLSLFDVSNPSKPLEVSNFKLKDSWSDISNTHHAFLHDREKRVFFVPTTEAGYIFKYDGDQLLLERSVSDIQALRSAFINDTMYVVGTDEIVALDQNTWLEQGRLKLKNTVRKQTPVFFD